MPNYYSSNNLSTETSTYTKVIVIKIDTFESTVVDERNFGLNDTQKISDFIDLYSKIGYACIKTNVDWEGYVL